MTMYNSINDVVVGHINNLIEANNLDATKYPFQNDINSALVQLAAIYAELGDKTAPTAADAFSIAGAVDALLTVVDSIVSPASTPTPNPDEETMP